MKCKHCGSENVVVVGNVTMHYHCNDCDQATDLVPEDKFTQQELTDFWYWRTGGDSFTCRLYYLIGKADPKNRLRLAMGFPTEVAIFTAWQSSRSTKDFLIENGFPAGRANVD